MTTWVKLNGVELMIAAQVGSIRRCQNIKNGERKTETFGIESNASWLTDIDGAAAELAFAKHKNLYWGGSSFFWQGADVGSWQVRSTTHSNGHLIIRSKDVEKAKDGQRFVLVVVKTPMYEMVGSVAIEDAMREEFWRPDQFSGGGAWWLPRDRLDPLEEYLTDSLSISY